MASTIVRSEEADSLSNLEERISRAIHLITQLRQERDAAIQRAEKESEAKHELQRITLERDALKADNARLEEELHGLRSERKQVRTRIEKLLGQMDLLSPEG